MKSLVLGSMIFFTATLASASESTRLMEVRLHSGFTPPQYSYAVKCEISSMYVMVESRKGNVKTSDYSSKEVVWTKAVPNVKAALTLITAAARSKKLVESMGPTDGPSSVYTGVLEGDVVDRMVKLSIDYSEVVRLNPAKGVEALVEFGQANCARP